jgi:hypothetical protein
MKNNENDSSSGLIKWVAFPVTHLPSEKTSAEELGALYGAEVASAESPGKGVSVFVGGRDWPLEIDAVKKASGAWMWLRITEDGNGEISASDTQYLYAAVRLLNDGLSKKLKENLTEGILIEPTFSWNRPLFDGAMTQYWRSIRNFDEEAYVKRLAECGFTHLEVNSLQAHQAMEEGVADEFYPQFYNYAAGLNHFVDTRLTRGLWPTQYLEANLNRLKYLASLARKYGLKPGIACFEPRSLPEKFFARYPTLRGARVDHPFRSRLPRYTLAQDHPVTVKHYRELIQNLMHAVPDLGYISIFSNDSGAGFEHTASLYVGRNGGPYMIREWNDHDAIAKVAGESVVRYLRRMKEAAAEINPDFKVFLRVEPFKEEHDTIIEGLGDGVDVEVPTMLARGYEMPYSHPKYEDQKGVAFSIFHHQMDPEESEILADYRAKGIEPLLHYCPSSLYNQEPLLGIPFPRLLDARLRSLMELGIDRVSGFGGLLNTEKTPYWPIPEVIRSIQFTPKLTVDEVLLRSAQKWVGEGRSEELVALWTDFEEALIHQPYVPHYCCLGFIWQRTWDRPFVPDIEAISAEERRYYEKFACLVDNNPAVNDYGRDVLFELISKENAWKYLKSFDEEMFPRLSKVLEQAKKSVDLSGEGSEVFVDLYDRIVAYECWATAVRNVCAWVGTVYTYLESEDESEKSKMEVLLQESIDLELANTRKLLELWNTSSTEFMVVSGIAENGFIYGENFGELLERKIELTEKYRNNPPRIEKDVLWRIEPNRQLWD